MADFVLSNGTEITFDLKALTISEYRQLFKTSQNQDDEDKIMSRVCGMKLKDYQSMPYEDWRLMTTAFFAKCRNPVAVPNSQSESTST